MNRKVLVVVGAILLSLVSCCGACMIAGLVGDPNGAGLSTGGGSAPSTDLDGRYACWMRSAYWMNHVQMTTQLASITFSIADGAYSTQTAGGSVTQRGDALYFSGGDMDGWVGSVIEGPSIIFGKNTRVQHTGPVNSGDIKCDPAK